MLISLLMITVPMLTVIFFGNLCREKGTVPREGVEGLKKLVTGVLLPAMVLGIFGSMQLSFSTLLVPATSCLLCFFAYFIGTKTEKRMGEYGPTHRFLVSSAEPGMLGYALFALLYGAENSAPIALFDGGLAMFFFTFYLPRLSRAGGAGTEGKSALRTAAESPILRMLVLGLILNLTGLYDKLMQTGAGEIVSATLSMLSTPVSCLMLFSVGYGMRIEKETLAPVLKTSLCRLLAFLPLGGLGCLLLKRAGFGPAYTNALLLFCCLPASYLVSAYITEEKQQRYANTQLSLHALISIVATILIKAFLPQ